VMKGIWVAFLDLDQEVRIGRRVGVFLHLGHKGAQWRFHYYQLDQRRVRGDRVLIRILATTWERDGDRIRV
jgi:hypothetical protein